MRIETSALDYRKVLCFAAMWAFVLMVSGSIHAQADIDNSSKITLSTNVLSFFGGHMGPEFRVFLPSRKPKSQYVFGYRFAFAAYGLDGPFPENDLTVYRQSLKGAHDLTVGIKYNFKVKGWSYMPFLTVGRFAYANDQVICLKAGENPTDIRGYCPCEEVGNNTFKEVAYRIGGGFEVQYNFLNIGQWSIGASGAILLAGVTRERKGFAYHDSCGEEPGYDQGQLPHWGENTSPWLHGIPYTSDQRREASSFMVRGRLGLWVNYKL